MNMHRGHRYCLYSLHPVKQSLTTSASRGDNNDDCDDGDADDDDDDVDDDVDDADTDDDAVEELCHHLFR